MPNNPRAEPDLCSVDVLDADSRPAASTIAHGVATLFSGQAIAYALTFLTLPLLAVLYAPSDFAVLGLFAGAAAVLGAVAPLGFDKVIPLIRSDAGAANAVAIVLICGSAVSIATGIGATTLFSWLPPSAQLSKLDACSGLLAVSVLAIGCQQALLAWAVRRQAFRVLATVRVALCLVRVACQIACAAYQPNPVGLVVGFTAGQVAAAGLSAWLIRGDSLQTQRATWHRIIWAVSRYRHYPVYAVAPDVIQRLSVHLPGFLLAFTYGYEVAGWYVMTQRLFGAPQTFLQQAVSRVLVGVGAADRGRSPDRIRSLARLVFARLVTYAGPPYMLATLAMPWLLGTVLGEAWAMAGVYCGLLAPMFFVRLVAESLRPTLDLVEQPELHVVGAVLLTAGLMLGIGVPYLLAWSATVAITGMSLTVGLAQLTTLMLIFRTLAKVTAAAPQRSAEPNRLPMLAYLPEKAAEEQATRQNANRPLERTG